MEIMLDNLLGKKKKNTVWDDYVPIVKTKKGMYHCYMSDAIEAPFEYNELCFLLDNASADTTIYLHLNTPGGHLDSAFKIMDSIINSEAKVVAILTGTVASAGTIITMACDEVVTSSYLSFMIHNYSTGMHGKGHELKAYQNFTDRELNRAFKDIYRGFLTEAEMDKVIDGLDMWINEEEVEARLEARREYLNQGN